MKSYYDKRVLIDTQSVLNSTFPDVILCLSGAQVDMLRNLTQYLHRRSTFAEDYTDAGYLAPSNDDWSIIQGIVADLEEQLMATLCEAILVVLQEQADALKAMEACICHLSTLQEQSVARLPDLTGYVDQFLVNYGAPDESEGNPSIPPTDVAKCELAQAFYYYIFQMYTEELLPFANSTADTITAALVAASTFAGLASFIGLPVALLANIVLAIVAWGIDGAIANFTNWLWDNKDEMVCILYDNYPDYAAAASALGVYIDAAEDITFLDKQVLKSVALSTWHMTWVSEDQQVNGTWDASFIPGQCDACVPLPAGCAPVSACDLLDWNGGTVACVSGRAQIQGGDSYYLLNTIVAPALPSWVTLNWIPRATAFPTAKCSFGVRDMVTTIEYNLLTTGSESVDIERMDYAALPAAVVGHECQLWVKQETWFCEPVYFCLTDVDPS
jgi:hypothetical protein